MLEITSVSQVPNTPAVYAMFGGCPSIVASWFDYPVSSTAVGVF
jgi:hypothetical protein